VVGTTADYIWLFSYTKYPEKAVENTIREYCPKEPDALELLDISIFGSGKEGRLITVNSYFGSYHKPIIQRNG